MNEEKPGTLPKRGSTPERAPLESGAAASPAEPSAPLPASEPAPKNTAEETESTAPGDDPALPRFLVKPGKVDRWLLTALGIMTVYGLALIPFRAYLLVNHTFIYTLLTGSSLSVLSISAQTPNQPLLWAGLVTVAALSGIKFLVIYYLMGKHWGEEFISWIFASHTPLWYRKLEGFVQRHLYFCLFLAFIPFSPIPATILVAIAGIRKHRGWVVAGYVFLLALLLKCFYLYLGVTFGEGVQPVLMTIDRYMMQATLLLLAYMFFMVWFKNRKKA